MLKVLLFQILKPKMITLNIIAVSLIIASNSFGACERGELFFNSFTPYVIDFNSSANQTVSVQVTHSTAIPGPHDCLYFVSAKYGAASSWTTRRLEGSPGDTIPFNIFKTNPASSDQIIRDQPDVTSTNQILYWPIFAVGPGSTQTKTFFTELGTIPASTDPGVYTEAITFKLVARPQDPPWGDFWTWTTVDERAITFRYVVQAELNIALVESGNPLDTLDTSELMSFGKLQSGQSEAADIMIDTNMGYRLFLSSMNNGNLKHLDLAQFVNYSLTVDGTPITLAGSSGTPVLISSNPSFSPPTGYRLPTVATIGTLTGTEAAGTYRDTLIMTIEAF